MHDHTGQARCLDDWLGVSKTLGWVAIIECDRAANAGRKLRQAAAWCVQLIVLVTLGGTRSIRLGLWTEFDITVLYVRVTHGQVVLGPLSWWIMTLYGCMAIWRVLDGERQELLHAVGILEGVQVEVLGHLLRLDRHETKFSTP